MNQPPKVIVFDAFGTLVKLGESRSPYRKLMKWLKESGRKPTTKDANIIMSNALDIEKLSILFGKEVPRHILDEINNDLQSEIKTIELYEDTIPSLQHLKNRGFKIALCSNLAMPYGEKLKTILPNLFDTLIFSYEVSAIKPELNIYKVLSKELICPMSDMLFIGDHPILDVEVPLSLGMSARLIKRDEQQTLADTLSDFF